MILVNGEDKLVGWVGNFDNVNSSGMVSPIILGNISIFRGRCFVLEMMNLEWKQVAA